MQFDHKTINLQRFPKTGNKSLRPWSAADELLLKTALTLGLDKKSIVIAHDTFGAMAVALNAYRPHSVINQASQLKALRKNLENNGLDTKEVIHSNPLKIQANNVNLALVKVPKSADLFQLYLQQLHAVSSPNSVVLCGFLTRNFTAKWIEIAELYFDDVSQSLAERKARLLILKSPKKSPVKVPLFHSVTNDLGLTLKQYAGVFSSGKVDLATRLLLDNMPEFLNDHKILDLACGNGVIATYVRKQAPRSLISVLDDNFLAIASAKLNLGKDDVTYHWSDTVNACRNEKFDFICCNPPFHFEYENTIEISLKLFSEAASALKVNGSFYIVANTHLNYTTHLAKLFTEVIQLSKNGKYEILVCKK
jgi:23S rRNA (guanine1835-N2)-methyltransferase